MVNQIVVVTLCGTPASGKTTFCKQLIQELSQIATVFYLSFDHIENILNQQKTWNRETWKQSRIQSYQQISSLLYDLTNCNSLIDKSYEPYITKTPSIQQSTLSILLIDDTMHLRSMRRSVMKICQFYEIGYCTILLSCTKENCYKRNAQRNELERVPETSIDTVFDSLEPPDPSLYWEKYSISICSDSQQIDCSSIYLLINEASLHPLKQNCIKREENIQSYTSFLHQLDLELRKSVNTIAKSISKEQKYKMKEINDEKKKQYSIAKSLCDDIDDSNSNNIIHDVIQQFNERCSKILKQT